ncbi:hypothetical protein CYFUS_009563 [Cystobacter fuscus]|uniref:Uncharacterized protein n=1 Tax=Cystobacter fuscus TaxID=43 RepID=A0A250JKS7_9BACT|nr:hypothetical protein [Cystobacter fuscus]ATB44082.1 hypothetical protein CYFUS_009563 [Cystobacter fuscus]
MYTVPLAQFRPISTGLTASLLGILLVSCGASRHIAPPHPEDLTQFVLFIRESPDGTVTHSWQRAGEVDLSPYKPLARAQSAPRPIVLAMGQKRDCDQENRECIRKCMNRPLERGFGHITSGNRGRGGKERYCNEQCMQPYRDCTKLEEQQPQEFTSVDSALDWMKRNRHSLLVGSVVVAAGVAFVVVSASAGLIILAPAALLATPTYDPAPYMAGVSP